MLVPVGVIFEVELTGMSRMKCGWCGKDKDEVDHLIAGYCVNICNACVILCIQKLADGVSPEFEIVRPKCSFCGEKPIPHKKRLVPGKGDCICEDCLNLCADIIDKAQSVDQVNDNKSSPPFDEHDCDCSGERAPLSAVAEEWAQLV